jgi:DnaK suppressor protein
MSPEDAVRMRATLLDTRARLVAEGPSVVRVESDEPVASAADEDEAPYKEMGQAIASSRNRERAERLAHIDDALRRLVDDPESFGVCEECDDDIPPRRLEIMPWARMCAPCQGAVDPTGRRSTRRKVTDYS